MAALSRQDRRGILSHSEIRSARPFFTALPQFPAKTEADVVEPILAVTRRSRFPSAAHRASATATPSRYADGSMPAGPRQQPVACHEHGCYQLQPDGNGTRLTESYEVTQPISRLGWLIIGRLYGCRDRHTELRAGMQQTAVRIRETAERDARSGRTSPDTATPNGRSPYS